MVRFTRRQFLAVAGVSALAGCSSDGSTTQTPDDTTEQTGAVPIGEERLPLPREPMELQAAARSGGPPKDGIPSIDEPSFVAASDADFLSAESTVFGVATDGDVRAYPQKILVRHEIINDTIDDRPVAVTYCPLTGTAMGFERGSTTFGVSGRLINNNLVMYDRATETWWPQVLATAIPGPWNEDPSIVSVQEFPVVWTTFERWRDQYPETQVLSTDTGFANNYDRDPYGSRGYYVSDSTLFPRLNPDDRYPTKAVFVGVRTPAGAAAFRKETLASEGIMTGRLAGSPIVAVYDPDLATAHVYRNPEQAAFVSTDEGIEGPDGTVHAPDGLPLARVLSFDAMWFAWSGFYPQTTVYA